MSKESQKFINTLRLEAKKQGIHYVHLARRVGEGSDYFSKVFLNNYDIPLSKFITFARALGYRVELVKDETIKDTFLSENPEPIPGVHFSEYIKPAPIDNEAKVIRRKKILNGQTLETLTENYKKAIKR
jgi:hypothetical protein